MKTHILLLCGLGASALSAETQRFADIPPSQQLWELITNDPVTTLLTARDDLHHLHLSPKRMAALLASDQFISIGGAFLPEINIDPQDEVEVTDLYAMLDQPIENDPHFWLSPRRMMELTEKLGGDPAQFVQYDQAFENIEWKSTLVAHNAFGYLVSDYGTQIMGAFTDSHDHQAGSAEHGDLLHLAEHGQIECIILDANEPSAEVAQFARTNNIPSVEVDVIGWKFSSRDDFFAQYYGAIAKAFEACE